MATEIVEALSKVNWVLGKNIWPAKHERKLLTKVMEVALFEERENKTLPVSYLGIIHEEEWPGFLS